MKEARYCKVGMQTLRMDKGEMSAKINLEQRSKQTESERMKRSKNYEGANNQVWCKVTQTYLMRIQIPILFF